jgi:hypothetical protein
MAVVPHKLYLSLFLIKLKARHFDTIEVIEAESQAVLNTLREQGRAGKGAYVRKGTTSGMIVTSRPKVSF